MKYNPLKPYNQLPYLPSKADMELRAGIGNLKTSGNYLKQLEDKGFLKSEIVGKEKLYLNYELMNLLKNE